MFSYIPGYPKPLIYHYIAMYTMIKHSLTTTSLALLLNYQNGTIAETKLAYHKLAGYAMFNLLSYYIYTNQYMGTLGLQNFVVSTFPSLTIE